MNLHIRTEAELLAAKNSEGGLVIEGDFICEIDIKFSYAIKFLVCRNAVIGGYADIGGNADIRGCADIGGEYLKVRNYLKLSCLLGVRVNKLQCKAVVPAACSAWDREFWGLRFGIDTSNGCWDEFVKRLSVVAPRLLKKKHWLTVEKLMLESSIGKYHKEVADGNAG